MFSLKKQRDHYYVEPKKNSTGQNRLNEDKYEKVEHPLMGLDHKQKAVCLYLLFDAKCVN
jgi:hypothetical protein